MRLSILDESKRQESSIKSYLTILLTHMLKCKYQYDYPDKHSWRNSIYNSVSGIRIEFKGINKGSLYKSFYAKTLNIDEIYDLARKRASTETRLPLSYFPEECEWNRFDLINTDFIYNFINEYGYGNEE